MYIIFTLIAVFNSNGVHQFAKNTQGIQYVQKFLVITGLLLSFIVYSI